VSRDEALAILGVLVAEYGEQIPEARATLVLEELARWDAAIGAEAARRMIRRDQWFSLARLVAWYEAVAFELEHPELARRHGAVGASPESLELVAARAEVLAAQYAEGYEAEEAAG
jgi:hypothetical protein